MRLHPLRDAGGLLLGELTCCGEKPNLADLHPPRSGDDVLGIPDEHGQRDDVRVAAIPRVRMHVRIMPRTTDIEARSDTPAREPLSSTCTRRDTARNVGIAREEIEMPQGRGSNSLKDPELYEELREDGASKEKAARISNAAARDGRKNVGRRGGESGDYEDWTVDELKKRAKELGITGYSGKKKAQIISMLRDH